MNQKKVEIPRQDISKFWEVFKQGNLKDIKTFYNDKVILLPRSFLMYKSLGINPSGDRLRSKEYSRDDIFIAYSNLQLKLPTKKWKYLFSDIDLNKKDIEISIVKKSKAKRYIVNNYNISSDDIVLLIPMETRDKLLFVFSKDSHKIIAQTIILVFPGSHYFDDFKP